MYTPIPEHQDVAHDYLTYDETLAAEAAFAGRPMEVRWTERARAVYVGLRHAIENREG